MIAAAIVAPIPSSAQQLDPFHWTDFHSPKDQDVVVWVTRALAAENWSAIREIGVQYDAALVVTAQRSATQANPTDDSFSVWSVNLTNHALTPLLTGYNLRWLGFMTFTDGGPAEPVILYDNCAACAPDTYFTAFHYDITQHVFAARWMRGGQGVPVGNANPPASVSWTQVYSGLAEPNGAGFLATWIHLDYAAQKPPDDYVYRYDVEPFSRLDRTQLLSGKDADAMKLRLCRSGEALPGIAHGQDSELCRQLVNPKPERRPVTTPPAHNRGQSVPGGHPH
ncbi:MAG TPA: hypothetical protein VN776_02935 [Terracidiphilus sp.]|nr:hypothetical protein [Terracidiphilus sp.]